MSDKAAKLLKKNLERVLRLKKSNRVKFCEETGISYTQLALYLSGTHSPSLNNLFRIADGLGVEAWELLKDWDAEPTNREYLYCTRIIGQKITRDAAEIKKKTHPVNKD